MDSNGPGSGWPLFWSVVGALIFIVCAFGIKACNYNECRDAGFSRVYCVFH